MRRLFRPLAAAPRCPRPWLARRVVIALMAGLGVAGCQDLTEMVLVVTAEPELSQAIDALRVEVTGPAGPVPPVEASLRTADTALPLQLSMSPAGAALEPVQVQVTASQQGTAMILQSAALRFYADERRLLQIHLEQRCMGICCGSAQTCREGRCTRRQLARADLPLWREDSIETPDPPTCFAGALESCNGFDDDCDGEVDEDFDLASDAAHCGVCGFACQSGKKCVLGVCEDGAERQICGF
ncbi:MAG: hypothetical protein ACPGUV_06055 [Polyangiales bacterium]